MANQFDVLPNPASSRGTRPYIVILQADLIDDTELVLCAPLIPAGDLAQTLILHPRVHVKGLPFHVLMDELAPLPRRRLKSPVGSLAADRGSIARAIDLLFFGI
ncbi:MAG: CcdB family protein [Phreatobacter sp.]|uniref:CcdB family protein n=1 Tax=Phreatobacter sp. TaxID=1966341 RepID=UPI001A629FA3|nr:CcdB family protein [Phreatobacter sp.]MBL8569227.1 CcdB family protein [Phreatobacter sp.]